MIRKYISLICIFAGILGIFTGCKNHDKQTDNQKEISVPAYQSTEILDIFVNDPVYNPVFSNDKIYFLSDDATSAICISCYDIVSEEMMNIGNIRFEGNAVGFSASESDFGILYKNGEQHYVLIYDSEGNQESEIHLTNITLSASCLTFCIWHETVYVAENNILYIYSYDGEYIGQQTYEGDILSIHVRNDDRIAVISNIYAKNMIQLDFYLPAEINPTEKQSITLQDNDSFYSSVICDDSAVFLCTETTLVKYVMNSDESVILCSWNNVNLIYQCIYELYIYHDSIYIFGKDAVHNRQVLWKLSQSDMSGEKQTKEQITVSYMEDGTNYIPKAAMWFNCLSEQYEIICVEYTSQNQNMNYSDLLSQYDLDLISNQIGDVLIMNNTTDYKKYEKIGAFSNLYEIDDACFDNLFNCAVKPYETDGGLYVAIPGFTVNTIVCNNEAQTDALWNLEQFVKDAQNISDEKQLIANLTRESMLNTFLKYGADEFFDIENDICSFTDNAFLSLLDYIYKLPDRISEFDENDITPYLNGDIILYQTQHLLSFVDYLNIKARFGFDNKVSVIGYPSGKGSVSEIIPTCYCAISSQSNKKSGAMQFINFLLTGDFLMNSERGMRMIPSNKSVFYEWAEMENDLYYYFEPGSLHTRVFDKPSSELTENQGKTEKKIDSQLVHEYEQFLDTITVCPDVPDPIFQIMKEEIEMFLSDSSDAISTAEKIQSRVQLYISEQQ